MGLASVRVATPPHRRGVEPIGRLALEQGGAIDRCRIGWESLGEDGLPVVVATGGISAGRHLASGEADPSPGWWEGFVGEGLAVDPGRYRVLSFDWVGGAGQSTGPDAAPEGPSRFADRRPFPPISPVDQARALVALLDREGIRRVHGFVGSSYGAMVGLAFAARWPDRVERLVAISGTHRTHPMATALRALQRRILRFGASAGAEDRGIVLARALAMTTYRSAVEFEERFDRAPEWQAEGGWSEFPVERYLIARGEAFAGRFSVPAFLTLSESLDLQDVDPGPVRARTHVVTVAGDPIAPEWQARELVDALGSRARLTVVESRFGHDAFLKEPELLGPFIRDALDVEVDR